MCRKLISRLRFILGITLLLMAVGASAGPLHDAVEAGDQARVKRLVMEESADINEIDERGIWPLLAAATDGNTAMVELLLKLHADPNRIDQYQYSALHEAASLGYHEVIEILIDAGARVNVRDINSITPLGYALRSSDQTSVELLQSVGAVQ